ncbi:stAR-related lipid transfer protein 9 isoform X2 [Macrotis lagotis]|uniref:stAR-related lipid transfer protein 9 isoform X2 n=1 Tax=Macrotis lagotis TaxID=92651 RepID=UPI003D69BAD6
MANVRVAVRVRPLSQRETANGGRIIIEIDDKVAKIKNLKVDNRPDGPGGSREKVMAFGFDYCYWSVNPEDPQYASQDVASLGLTPRICEGLFSKKDDYSNSPSPCRIRVSFLEIYNERVRDLLKQSDQKKPYTLRVREHPETGPYVQGLSQHVVTNSKQIIGLLEEGVANRITAATHVHEASSRSHAIFTIYYTQAVLENNLSSEVASKINLVDLAGSERADPSYCKDRITEGASINKSLVTLGIVISTLAQNSQMFISYQSPNSTSTESGDNGSLSSPSVAGSIGGIPRKQLYIPYRDSVLTWLLKDSLGGNSKTIMVATVSPASSSYNETMSTLRYASSAKNIINKPRVNEDANVKLIRELREEIERLKGMLLSFELGNLSPFTDGRNGNLKELIFHNEMKGDQPSKDWTQKWDDWKALMEQYNVDISKKKAGVTIDSNLPHLMVLDDDVLSTAVVLYHLREGTTKIGRIDSDREQDIVLQGQWIERDHCTITSARGVVTLQPALGARCSVNGQEVTNSCRLTQGAIIILGETQKFRFVHPEEAATLRQRRLLGEISSEDSSYSLEWLNLDGAIPAHPRPEISSVLEEGRRVQDVIPEAYHQKHLGQIASHRMQIRQQKRLVKDLKQDILAEQIRAEQELEFEQALISQQIKDNQQWLLREENWLASLQQQQQQQQQDDVLAKTDSGISPEDDIEPGSETSLALLGGDRKRLVQLQVLWRNAIWAAENKVRSKKVKFQLERIVKKQKLLEAQKKLEQLETLCWEDLPSQSAELDPELDATFSAFQKNSRTLSSSSLGNQRLCGLPVSPSQSVLKCENPAKLSAETVPYTPEKPQLEEYLLQISSVPTETSNDTCSPDLWQVCEGKKASVGEDTLAQRASPSISPKIASAMDQKSQEVDGNKYPVWLHRNLVSVNQSTEQIKMREKPDSPIPSPEIVTEKPNRSHGPSWRKCQREGDLLTNRNSRVIGSSSPHSQGTKRSVIRGKVQTNSLCQAAWTLEQWQPSTSSLTKASAWPWGCLFGMKEKQKRPLQSPEKRQDDERTWCTNILNPPTSCLRNKSQENEKDFSETDSTYSMDSLSCVCTRTLIRSQKQEAPKPKPYCIEPENSESDDSQMSQDSLMEKRNRTQRRFFPCSSPPQASEKSEFRLVTSPKASLAPPENGLCWNKVRTFSLDSLNNEEEAFREESEEGSTSHSSDEMPAEVFWQVKSSQSFTACQEEVLEFQAPDQGTTGPDRTPQPSGSFYLAFQLKTETDEGKPLRQTQQPRNNSLVSMDSWFSCDSGNNFSGSQEVNTHSQMNLDIQEPEIQDMEKPKALVKVEELQQSVPEIAAEVCSFSHLQGLDPVPNSNNEGSIAPSLDVSSEATWRSQGPLKSGSDVTVSQSFHEGRGLANLAGYCSPVSSNTSPTSSMSAAPASLLSHKGSAFRKGRPVIEYPCEFSHSSLGVTVKNTQVSSSSQKDTSYLPFTSGKRWDSFFPTCPEMPGDFDFNDPSFSLLSMRRLTTEQERDGGSFELDDLSTCFRTIEKDAHHSCSLTDLEAGDSGLENAWVFAMENKVSASMIEGMDQTHQVSAKQPQPLPFRRTGSASSFDESFFLRDISNSSSPMSTKEDQGPTAWAQQVENLPSKLALSQPVMKAELLQNTNEETDRERSFSLSLPTDSEPFPPWVPFPSPEQPHPLESFYVLESRDALTETALEIPAYREWGEEKPSTGRAEAETFQFLRNVDSDLLLLLNTPNNTSSQQIVAERSFSPGTKKELSEIWVPKSMDKYNTSVPLSSTHSRLLLESMGICQAGKPAGILNDKHPQSSLKIKEKSQTQPPRSIPFSDSGVAIHLPVNSNVEGDHKHRQNEGDMRGKPAGYLLGLDAPDFEGQIHSKPNSNFIYKTASLSQTQHRVNMQENDLVSKKHSSASHSRCVSPGMMDKDEILSHPQEGTEPVSLGVVLHPKDCSEELMPHSASIHLPAVSSKEEGPVANKEPGSLAVTSTSQGEMSRGRKHAFSSDKITNHSEEIARLISSVSQLEDSIMEIDSWQRYYPRVLYMAEAYRRAKCKDRKDQEKVHFTLNPNDFRDGIETQGIKVVNSCIQESHQAQNVKPNLTRSTEFIEEEKFERKHTLLPVPEMSIRDPSDYLFLRFPQSTVQEKPGNAPENPEIVEPLVRIDPLRPQEERSEESCNEDLASELNPQSHATEGTEIFPELQPKDNFQESQDAENPTNTMIVAKCKEPRVCDIDQESSTLQGKTLQTENHSTPLAQELPIISQTMHMSRFCTQETAHSLPSQECHPVAPTQDETGSIIFSSVHPQLSEKHFKLSTKAVSLSSNDSEPELKFLKTQIAIPSEGRGEEQQRINEEARNHSSLRSVSCKNSFVEHSVCQSSGLKMVSDLSCQSNGGESSPDEPSGDNFSMKEIKASATAILLEKQGGDSRITPNDLNLGNAHELEMLLLRKMKRASSLNQCPLEKRASHQQEDSELQVSQIFEKLWRTGDFAIELDDSLSAGNEGKEASSSEIWGASANLNPKTNVETTVEDTRQSEECEKSLEESTDEQITVPKLPWASSTLWRTSSNSSMYPKTDIETKVEDTRLSEECGKSSENSTDEQIIIPKLTRVSSVLWGPSINSSMYPKPNIFGAEDTRLSEECGKSSEDSTDEQIIVPKLVKFSRLQESSANSSMYPEANAEAIIEDTRLSEECGKSSENSTDEQIIMPKLARVSLKPWEPSANSSMYPKANAETTVEDPRLAEECGKSSEDSTDEQIIMPKLTKVSPCLWRPSANSSMYSEVNVETTIEDTRISEEYGKSSEDSTDEQIVMPKLTKVSSRFWRSSANSFMYPKANIETTLEDTRLSEECGKSSEDNIDKQIIMPKLTRVSSVLWGASVNSSMYPKTNVETTVGDIRLSEECGKSSEDSTDEQILMPKLIRVSPSLRGAPANSFMCPEANVEATVEDTRLSEKCGKSSEDSTDEQIIMPKLTRISSVLWSTSANSSMYPKVNLHTTAEDIRLSEECGKSSEDSPDEQIIVSKLSGVSSRLWGPSVNSPMHLKVNAEITQEDTRLSEEYGKSSEDSTDEQILVPELTRVSSRLSGTYANSSMHLKVNAEITVEDTRLSEVCEKSSEECGKSSGDSTDEQIIMPKLIGVSSGLSETSANSSTHPKVNAEITVEDTRRSEWGGKSSEDSTDEQIIVPKVTRVSSGFSEASANSSMHPKMNTETTVEDTSLSEEYGKSLKDSTDEQIILSYSETLLELEAFSGTPKQPHCNQRDQLELVRSQDEDESQSCFMQNKVIRGRHIQETFPGIASRKHPDKNNPVAKLFVGDALDLMNDVVVPGRGSEHDSTLSFSTMANPGFSKASDMQTAGEKLTEHFDPQVISKSPVRKEEVIKSPSPGNVASGNLLFPLALKENKMDEPPPQQPIASSLHAISNSFRVIDQELSQALSSKQIGTHSEVERTSLGSKESIRRAWEGFSSQSIACESLCGGDLDKSSETMADLQNHWGASIQSSWKDAPLHAESGISEAEMSCVMVNSTTIWPDLMSQETFHVRKQPDYCEVYMVEAEESLNFDSPVAPLDIKQSGSLHAHSRCVHSPGLGERRASHQQNMVVPGTVEGGSPGGTLPQYPKMKGVSHSGKSMAYGVGNKCPRSTFLDENLTSEFVGKMENCPEESMVQSNLENPKSSIIFISSTSQEEVVTSPSRPPCMSQGTTRIDSPSFLNSLSYGNNDPEKRISRSASDTMLPVFLVSSKHNLGCHSRRPKIALTCNLNLREDQQKLRLEASNIGLFSMESSGRVDIKKTASITPEMTPLPARTSFEKLENIQEKHKVSQNKGEFPSVAKSGHHIAAGRLEAKHVNEGILEDECRVGSPHFAEGQPFPKNSRNQSVPIPYPRTKVGKKCILRNLLDNLQENEQLSNNFGSTVRDRNQDYSGTNGQASPQECRDSLRIDGKPERCSFLSKRNEGTFDAQGPCSLPEVSQDDLDTGSHFDSSPCIAFPLNLKHSLKDFSSLKLSVGTSSRFLQELNMSVEPPSPTEDEESCGIERLYLSNLSPNESEMMLLMELGKIPRSADCGQTALSNYSLEPPSLQPSKSGIAPCPTSSALLTLSVTEGGSSDIVVEEHNNHPRKKGCFTPANMNGMQFTSDSMSPFLQSCQQGDPGKIAWKKYVLDSASDDICSQISWNPDIQGAVCCSSIDNGLNTSGYPSHSHPSSYASTHGLSCTLSSTEDSRGLEEERKECKTSGVFRNHHDFSDGFITTLSARTPDMIGKGLPEESQLLQDEDALTEQGKVSRQVNDVGLQFPIKSESCPKTSVATCEQGMVTLAPTQLQQVLMPCQDPVDATHPNPEISDFMSHPPPATWTSMHNLSLHLSQLLHNTSELLGNLTHQGMSEREWSIKTEALEEATKAMTMDSSTQTTVDVGIQTDEMDPAPKDVSLHCPMDNKLTNPQEANVTAPKHGSLDVMDAWDAHQEKVDHPLVLQEKVDQSPVFQEKEPECTGEKQQTSSSSGSQRDYTIPQKSPSTSHQSFDFQKYSLAQDSLVSPQDSSVASPNASCQMDGSYFTAVTPLTSCTSSSFRGFSLQEGGSTCESRAQRNKKAGYRGILLVDRASSPILTLSASPQDPSSSSSLNPTCHRASCSHSTKHHQKPGAAQVITVNNFSQTCIEGETRNISGDSGKSTEKKLSKGFPSSDLSGTLKRSLCLQGNSSMSAGLLNHPQQLQVQASLGLLAWEEQLAGRRKKPNSWERPLYLSLPVTELSPTEGQSEASNTSNFVAEVALEVANPKLVQLASQSTSWNQKRTSTGAASSEGPLKSLLPSEAASWGAVPSHCQSPFSISEVSVAPGLSSIARDTQSEILLRSCTQKVHASESKYHSLRDLPVHNKFSNWCGVQGSSIKGTEGTILVREMTNVDNTNTKGMGEKPAQPHEHLSQVPEQLQREQVQVLAGVPLELGRQTPPLSVELAEAKLLYGLGETDALLRVMQSGTGEALVPITPMKPHQEDMHFRHLKTIEVIRRERSDRLQNFRRTRSHSPMKHLSLLPTPEGLNRDPDLPSRRREYLQQLRKDVVETTRNLEPVSDVRSHQPSDIEVMLQDYQRAREETKMEIARARDRLRERAEQEKQRIRQQIVSQLQREEAKLQTLVSVSTLCTSSMDSLSSSPTSGYDSSNLTLASQIQPPEKQGNANSSGFKEIVGALVRGRSVVRNHQLYLTGLAQNLGHKPRGENQQFSSDRPRKSLIIQSNSDSCLSSSPTTLYQDLVKHILASMMNEVMAACSDNLQNLFSCQAAAGWKYQGEEKGVLIYYKGFPSATRHGFLGARVVPQPLPRVWAAVRDPTLWTLYDKSIQIAQLYQRVTSSIKLVYLVSNSSVNCLKQPRDFCCVSGEAKEGNLTIIVVQSVYDKSMPRPNRNRIRGEILPSAWILQPHTLDGKEVTKVIYMVQVELGAPGLPPGLLTHCAKQQPLVIANLASFLSS